MKRKILRFILALLIYDILLAIVAFPFYGGESYKILFLSLPIAGLLFAKPVFLIAEAVFDRAFDWRDEV